VKGSGKSLRETAPEKSRRGCREERFGLATNYFEWSDLRSHQALNVIVDYRLCKSWWQSNGGAVYCIHEHPSPSEGCAIRAYVHRASTCSRENQLD
jgi:hypothetical protein